jgi:hypothetical protein
MQNTEWELLIPRKKLGYIKRSAGIDGESGDDILKLLIVGLAAGAGNRALNRIKVAGMFRTKALDIHDFEVADAAMAANNMKVVKWLEERDISGGEDGFVNAVRNGHKKMVKRFIDSMVEEDGTVGVATQDALDTAYVEGKDDIVKLFRKRGAFPSSVAQMIKNDLSEDRRADAIRMGSVLALQGLEENLKFSVIDVGRREWEEAMDNAYQKGHIAMVRHVREKYEYLPPPDVVGDKDAEDVINERLARWSIAYPQLFEKGVHNVYTTDLVTNLRMAVENSKGELIASTSIHPRTLNMLSMGILWNEVKPNVSSDILLVVGPTREIRRRMKSFIEELEKLVEDEGVNGIGKPELGNMEIFKGYREDVFFRRIMIGIHYSPDKGQRLLKFSKALDEERERLMSEMEEYGRDAMLPRIESNAIIREKFQHYQENDYIENVIRPESFPTMMVWHYVSSYFSETGIPRSLALLVYEVYSELLNYLDNYMGDFLDDIGDDYKRFVVNTWEKIKYLHQATEKTRRLEPIEEITQVPHDEQAELTTDMTGLIDPPTLQQLLKEADQVGHESTTLRSKRGLLPGDIIDLTGDPTGEPSTKRARSEAEIKRALVLHRGDIRAAARFLMRSF